jgi:hypothetical protein
VIGAPHASTLLWWKQDGKRLADQCREAARSAERASLERMQALNASYLLYGGRSAVPAAAIAAATKPQEGACNFLSRAIDTLVAEVTQADLNPQCNTRGGDWQLQDRARKLSAWVLTRSDQARAGDIVRAACTDAAVARFGVLRAFREGDSCWVERIDPRNVLFDSRQCTDVPPREIYVRRAIPRHHMVALYPEHEKGLAIAPRPRTSYWYNLDAGADVVEVIEAWHLPSQLDADDGRHCIVVEGCEPLVEEHYDRSRFPLCFIFATPQPLGLGSGESVLERAACAQLELNRKLWRRSKAEHLHAVPRVFMPAGSVQKCHLQNGLGDLVEYSGQQPPVFVPPQTMGADFNAGIEQCKAWVFELAGVSTLAASAIKPAGLNSGKALRNYHEFTTRQWVNFERSIAAAKCDLAEDMIAIQREIADDGVSTVYYRDKGKGHEIAWSEIDIEHDKLHMTIAPVNALSNSPADRIEDIIEIVDKGLISPAEGLEMLPTADFEAVRQRVTAPTEYVREQLDRMLQDGEYLPPVPIIPPQMALSLAGTRWLRATLDGYPREHTDLLLRWMTDTQALQSRAATPPAAPPALGAPPLPAGVPEPIPGMPPPPGGPMPMPPPGAPSMPGLEPGPMAPLPPMM